MAHWIWIYFGQRLVQIVFDEVLMLGQINNEYRKLGQLMLDLLGRNMSVKGQVLIQMVLVKNYKVHQVVDIVSFQMKNEFVIG